MQGNYQKRDSALSCVLAEGVGDSVIQKLSITEHRREETY